MMFKTEKNGMKRAAAAITAAVMAAATVTGCSSDTDYSLTANGKKVNAGVYINYIITEMSNQLYSLYSQYQGEITSLADCFDKQIDGKDFITYVKDAAIDHTKEFAAVQAKFDELGLSISEEDAKTIEDNVSNAWNSQKDFYELEGISRESIKLCYEHSYRKDAIFEKYYYAGGIEAVSDEDVQKFVNDNYLRYKLISIPKSSETDEEAKNKENEELKALWEKLASEAESVDFAGFDKIIEEYNQYKEQKKAEKEAAEKAAAESTDSSSSEQSQEGELTPASAAAEESSETEAVTTAPEEDKPAETTTDASESEAPATTEDTSSAPDSDSSSGTETPTLISPASDDSSQADGAAEEKDPYENETINNYTEGVDTTNQYYSESYGKLLEAIKNTGVGKVGTHENENTYYIYFAADVSERTDYTADHRESLIHKMKEPEFDGLIKGWIEAGSIVMNDKAVKRYTVQEVYDRQEEYTKKQSRR